ncbi:sugar/nucleoside kinase (ribokinase family) [Amycolatopsis bartoniae]|uniref:Ribokinase n=1 Tax=Amycolatopsis bartoniae TaxID=941986 RepID=A0A8H9IV49_9PSEU|nr:PfkB family carbohydrate kinase [Amycolatopsis bartoniae]MBB2933001.1 sugar/nucleoside kinase (ribokinase family) [Amycolatopsis bartoniae]TVT03378.1 ribokinase [Amycolatopsis bartoniae]GHF56288.1 ribokinase [Amycolatopsis bartoniae]
MTVLLAGLCTIDVVQRVAELPAPGEKVQSLSVDVAAGGPATNAAVAVAALGGRAVLLTVLGSHPLADLARADLAKCGVEVVDVAPDFAEPPALSAVAVRDRDGERTVVSRNAAHSPEFHGEPWAVADVSAVLVDGHHPALALGTARWARSRGIPVVLDAGSWKPVLDELLPLVDIAACSAHFHAPEPGLPERGVRTVITTAGPDPVRWRTAKESGEVPVPAVEARDTLGAGDVWHGALAYGVGRFELPELIRYANEVAAERVRHVGPRAWVGRMEAR